MSQNQSIAEGWPETCAEVERILEARETVTEHQLSPNVQLRRRKKMSLTAFAKELKVDKAAAYRWIRGGQVPDAKNQKIVKAWTKKHAKALTSK